MKKFIAIVSLALFIGAFVAPASAIVVGDPPKAEVTKTDVKADSKTEAKVVATTDKKECTKEAKTVAASDKKSCSEAKKTAGCCSEKKTTAQK